MKFLSFNSFTKGWSLILMLLSLSFIGSTQGLYKVEEGIFKTEGSVDFKADFVGDFRILEAKLLVRTGFENGYRFGSSESDDTKFKLKITCNLVEKNGSTAVIPLSFIISNNKPSERFYLDLKKYISPVATSTGFTCTGFELQNIVVTPADPGDLPFAKAEEEAGVFIGYEAKYGVRVDPNNTNFDVVISAVDQNTPPSPRVREFKWASSAAGIIPAFELQLLRLYNSLEYPEGTIPDERVISCNTDWDNALSFYIENGETSVSLTIGEGTGYYTWRVRPVGTYYHGNIANADNYGKWTFHDFNINSNTGLADINPAFTDNHVFFFDDPDRDVNYSFNRVFSEESKVKEATTYATGLQQVKQSQIYLPSKNKTIVTQSILDYSGRPALTTMPVPNGEKPAGYQPGLVKTEGTDELYKAKHFDEVGNLYSPEKVKDAVGAFKYYSDNNTEDGRVPSAEGYPYTRVIYANDGTNRVIEQSGIGKTHMLGSQAEGKGRTVKTFYGTPSEDELVAVFGNEAPNHEQVLKVITVDQNNTTSISYQNLSGKVIATALTFTDATESLTPLDGETATAIPVEDKITNNTEVKDAFLSSKRLVLPEGADLNLDYKIKCQVLDSLCTSIEIDCGYKIKFRVINVRTEHVDSFAADLGGTPCVGDYKTIANVIQNLALVPGEYLIEKMLSKGEPSLEETEGKVKDGIRPLSNWFNTEIEAINCERQLYEFYNMVDHLGKKINETTAGFPQTIAFNCVGCPEEPIRTHDFSAAFKAVFDEKPEEYILTIYDGNGNTITGPFDRATAQPELIVVQTPCCALDFPVQYHPDFECVLPDKLSDLLSSNPNLASLNVNPYYLTQASNSSNYLVDFEGYAISMIHECQKETNSLKDEPDTEPTIEQAKYLFYNYMVGWHEEGLLNKMVFKMLTDRYSYFPYREALYGDGDAPIPGQYPCEKDDKNTGPQTEEDGIPEGYCAENVRSKIPGTNYYCMDLADCWKNAVMNLLSMECSSDLTLEDLSLGDKNIPDNVDDQNDDDAEEDGNGFNDHFDDNIKSGFVRFFVKLLLSKKMRNHEESGGVDDDGEPNGGSVDLPKVEYHLVQQFLECAGYKFADILEPAHADNPNYPINSIYTQDNTNNPNKDETCFIAVDYDFDGNNEREYNPAQFYTDNFNLPGEVIGDQSVWLGKHLNNDVTKQTLEDVFPHVVNPLYAFKYFEYKRGSHPQLEVEFCYKDPNVDMCKNASGEDVPCCDGVPCDFCGIGVVECPFTVKEWGASQRFQFHKALINMPKAVVEEAPFFSCTDVTEITNWYAKGTVLTLPPSEDDIQFVGNFDFISEAMYRKINDFTGSSVYGPVAIPGKSYVELIAAQMKKQCENSCNSTDRRKEFRNEVIRTFEERCYDLGGCKTSANDNKVPWEDVELIVDKLVDQCISQCPITTFSCETPNCRPANTPITTLGTPSIYLDLNYGVARNNECVGNSTDLGGMKNMTGCPNFTWAEYTFWNEAKSWKPQLDVKTKCNSDGIWVDGQAGTHYYDEYGNLVVKTGMEDCDNPDTFIEKHEYEIPERKGPYTSAECDERDSKLSQGKMLNVPVND